MKPISNSEPPQQLVMCTERHALTIIFPTLLGPSHTFDECGQEQASPMNKKQLSARDICTKFITPAVEAAGWDSRKQIREEVSFTDGRIIVQGKLYTRGKQKRADYILYYKPNIPLVIIEAKANTWPVGDGMQQAIKYAEALQVPFVFTSNGDSFVFKDMTAGTEREIAPEDFPYPTELWQKHLAHKGLEDDTVRKIVELPYYTDTSGMSSRYYQQNAVNRTMEAISKGQDRILLVMATGMGKTYTAFNIVWRLWKSGVKKRILFLADHNALLTQTRNEDFSPFGTDIMHIIKRFRPDDFGGCSSLTGTHQASRRVQELGFLRSFNPAPAAAAASFFANLPICHAFFSSSFSCAASSFNP